MQKVWFDSWMLQIFKYSKTGTYHKSSFFTSNQVITKNWHGNFRNAKIPILDRLRIWKFEGAPRPKYESRWPNFLLGLLIYMYFKDGLKNYPKTAPKVSLIGGVASTLPINIAFRAVFGQIFFTILEIYINEEPKQKIGSHIFARRPSNFHTLSQSHMTTSLLKTFGHLLSYFGQGPHSNFHI